MGMNQILQFKVSSRKVKLSFPLKAINQKTPVLVHQFKKVSSNKPMEIKENSLLNYEQLAKVLTVLTGKYYSPNSSYPESKGIL